MSVTPARSLALSALATIRMRDAWAHVVVDSLLSESQLSAPDRALVTRLVYGTVQTMGTLDEALSRHVRRPRDVQPEVRDALRMSAWELLFGGVDPHAAVHQGVEAVGRRAPHARGFANAVLRKLADEAGAFPWGDPQVDDAALARLHAHPLWLVESMLREYDRETVVAVLAANNQAAPLYVAHNPFGSDMQTLLQTLTSDGAEPQPGPVPGCITVGDPSRAVRGQAVASGQCLVVDAAAQLVARMTSVPDEGFVVDLAAGRGTKTALIQAGSGGKATILALDLHEFKTKILRQRMSHLSIPGVSVATLDARDHAAVLSAVGTNSVDRVLVDAPCSGLGALRRAPEKRWTLEPTDLEALAALGGALLVTASKLVRRGGLVVYSTCTMLAAENRDVVEGFLDSADGESFETRSVAGDVPRSWEGFITEVGDFQSLPLEGGPDGHYASVLEKV